MKSLTLLSLLLIGITGFSQSLIFNSGFEPNTDTINQTPSGADLTGIDNSVPIPNDWDVFDDSLAPGTFSIQYQGGEDTMRLAEITPDPEDPSNNVLKFWVDYPNVGAAEKSRVQANIYNTDGFDNIFYKTRFYIPNDLDTLKYLPINLRWFTLMEFWNDPEWELSTTGFRISVNLYKDSTEDYFYFGIHGQTYNESEDKYEDYWANENKLFEVPTGEWMTIKVHFIEGDDTDGKFWMSCQPEGESETIVFDLTEYTHSPFDTGDGPDGLTHFNPLKMYTSAELVDSLRNWGFQCHVYWDDFALWKDIDPATVSVAELVVENSQVYPNPSNGPIAITTTSIFSNAMLNIYDVQKRLVSYYTGLTGSVFKIDPNLPAGIYNYQIIDNNGALSDGKFVIQ